MYKRQVYQDLTRSDYVETDGGWISLDGKKVNTPTEEAFTLLANGEEIDIVLTRTITQSDFDLGGLSNTAIVNDTSAQVSDVSDDGDDTDGNTTNDPTIINFDRIQSLEVTKNATITDNGDGVNGVEDIISYTIRVKNNGNVNLTGLVVEDILSDAASTTMSLNVSPTYSSTYKLAPGTSLNTDAFWGSSSEPNQSSSNYRYVSIYFPNNPSTISDDRYYTNNHYSIIESSIATTTFNGYTGATLVGTYNGKYYYATNYSTNWTTHKTRSQTAHSSMLIKDDKADLEWIKSKRSTFTAISNNHWWIGLEQNHSASDYSHSRGGWYWVDGTKLANSGQVSETTINATTTLNAYEELSYTTSYTITQDNVDKALLSNIVSVTANYFSNTVTDTSDSRACGSSDNVTSYWASSQPTNSSLSNYGVLQRSDGKLVSYD